MIGNRIIISRGSKEEAEKPFWISFSDLMSALMVLFLLVMSVALLSVTREINAEEVARTKRLVEIQELLRSVDAVSEECGNFDLDGQTINFGDRANFDSNKSEISAATGADLRRMIPCVLQIANNPLGKKWFKRVVVEGYTDRTGDYLHNLNLSLQRSQRVLCVLLGAQDLEEQPLSVEQKKQIQQLFFVGGYSSGSAKENLAASRRIELRLEFWDLKEKREDPVDAFQPKIGKCAL